MGKHPSAWVKKYWRCKNCGANKIPDRQRWCQKCRDFHKARRARLRVEARERRRLSARRSWHLEVARSMDGRSSLHGMEIALQSVLLSKYGIDEDWDLCHRNRLRSVMRRFRVELESWFGSNSSTGFSKWQYFKILLRIGEFRWKARVLELEGLGLRSKSDLKRAKKSELVGWLRELLVEGYLTLDDLDPPPLVDDYEYGWEGEP